MIKTVKFVLAATAVATLVACGGGGGGSDVSGGSGETITYITSNGLKWSSPSIATYLYQSALSSTENDAFGYCSKSTSTNGGPSIPSNFNNETGWDVPTQDQITAFRLANPAPIGWAMVNIWFQHDDNYTGNLNTFINYGTGVVTFANTAAKANVVCVKPV